MHYSSTPPLAIQMDSHMTTDRREGTCEMAREIPIIFLVTNLAYGGAEAQVCRVATALSQRGWNIAVVTMFDCSNERPLPNVKVHRAHMERRMLSPRSMIRLWSTLRALKPSCLVTFNYPANIAGRVLGTSARIPAIVTSIRCERLDGYLRAKMLRWTDSLGTLTTTNSHSVSSGLVQANVVKEHRIRVIRNAIDLRNYRPCSEDRMNKRAELGVAEDEFLWLAVGRLERQKAYPELLEAVHLLAKRGGARMKLLIAGTGRLERDIRQLAASLGLDNVVQLLGHRKDVTSLLNAADSLVLSSAWEGLPNAVMEALAMGTPVVATHVGGVSELVSDSKSGFLVQAGDTISLADAMSTMMRMTQQQRLNMGAAGRRHIEMHFGLEHIVDQWECLIGGLLEQQDRAA